MAWLVFTDIIAQNKNASRPIGAVGQSKTLIITLKITAMEITPFALKRAENKQLQTVYYLQTCRQQEDG